MTIPSERTRAVIETRRFLELIAIGGTRNLTPEALVNYATALLRHYPSGMDMHLTAGALPMLWDSPLDPGSPTYRTSSQEAVASAGVARRKQRKG